MIRIVCLSRIVLVVLGALIIVVLTITGVLYSEIYVVTEPNQDRVIKSTTDAVDGTYKLKLTDANGNGLSTLSNDFDVIFN